MRLIYRVLRKLYKNSVLVFVIIYQKLIHFLCPIDEKKVFYLPVGMKKTGNAFALLNEWKEHENYIHVYLSDGRGSYQNVVFCVLGFSAIFHFSTAKYIIREADYASLGLMSRPDAIVIQLWHAAGAFKNMSSDVKNRSSFLKKNRQRDIRTWSMLACSSEKLVALYSRAFSGFPQEKIFVTGLPRNDFLYKEKNNRDDLLTSYCIDRKVKIVFYAPTFRDKPSREDDTITVSTIDFLAKTLPNEYVLAVRLHPSINNIKVPANVLKFQDCHVEEALCMADYLITDYSSIIFDYALLRKPMLFYVPDFERYCDRRGFYFDYESFVPGPIYKKEEELLAGIGRYDMKLWKHKIESFTLEYNPYFDGQNSKRVLDKILSLS